MRLIIISGRSGSGKSTALHVLEDVGFNCIDNLPVNLLPSLVQQLLDNQGHDQNLAVGVDARNPGKSLQKLPEILDQLKQNGVDCEVVYIDARTPTIVKRYSETRRKHPLSDTDTGLREAIDADRSVLEPIAALADLTIDTSDLSLHQLRDIIKTRVVGKVVDSGMAIMFMSFGFKRGIPVDADFVFDLRCLPNPFWKHELRGSTGRDQNVCDFLESQPDVADMINDITQFLDSWLPRFEANNRSYFTVALGCTGGQHRSVYLAEKLAGRFISTYNNVQVRHRELE